MQEKLLFLGVFVKKAAREGNGGEGEEGKGIWGDQPKLWAKQCATVLKHSMGKQKQKGVRNTTTTKQI